MTLNNITYYIALRKVQKRCFRFHRLLKANDEVAEAADIIKLVLMIKRTPS